MMLKYVTTHFDRPKSDCGCNRFSSASSSELFSDQSATDERQRWVHPSHAQSRSGWKSVRSHIDQSCRATLSHAATVGADRSADIGAVATGPRRRRCSASTAVRSLAARPRVAIGRQPFPSAPYQLMSSASSSVVAMAPPAVANTPVDDIPLKIAAVRKYFQSHATKAAKWRKDQVSAGRRDAGLRADAGCAWLGDAAISGD